MKLRVHYCVNYAGTYVDGTAIIDPDDENWYTNFRQAIADRIQGQSGQLEYLTVLSMAVLEKIKSPEGKSE